jgi:hypothetical protein
LVSKFVFEIKNFATISVEVRLRLTHRITHSASCSCRGQKCISFVWICCWCLSKSFCSIPIILVNFLGTLQFGFFHFLNQIFLNHGFATNHSLVRCLMLSDLYLFVFTFSFYSFNSLFFPIERLPKLFPDCNSVSLLEFFFSFHNLQPSVFCTLHFLQGSLLLCR